MNYPGVPPSQLETEVTRKIEDSVATATGIDHIRSTVTEGLSTTTIEFQLDRDVNQAVDDVRDLVSRIRTNLPGEIEEPIISRATTAGSPVVTYGVSAPGMSVEELSWFVDLTVEPRAVVDRRHGRGQARGRCRSRDPRGSRSRCAECARHDGRRHVPPAPSYAGRAARR